MLNQSEDDIDFWFKALGFGMGFACGLFFVYQVRHAGSIRAVEMMAPRRVRPLEFDVDRLKGGIDEEEEAGGGGEKGNKEERRGTGREPRPRNTHCFIHCHLFTAGFGAQAGVLSKACWWRMAKRKASGVGPPSQVDKHWKEICFE